MYKRSGSANAATHSHIRWDGTIITIAIANGGLGEQLAAPYRVYTKTCDIVYGIIAGVMWLIWGAVITIEFMSSRGSKGGEIGECIFSNSGSGEQSLEGMV